MNKVITINLGGNAYQLEEAGYDALRAYLETAAARLQGNPDRDEILSDIERAIADKFRAILASYKNVVEAKEVESVLKEMGSIEADNDTEPKNADTQSGTSGRKTSNEQPPGSSWTAPRRLYRIEEGAMVSGVCNGIGAYFNVDPVFIRLAFLALFFFGGTGILAYIVMVIVIPEAQSPEEKAAASGSPFTAQEFIHRAKEGYYEAMKGFPDRHARSQWTRQFKRQMRRHAWQWKHNWYNHWADQAPAHPGMGFALPMLSLIHAAATILWICAMVSLLAKGTVLGLTLPSDIPVWAAAILLLMAYGLFIGPLKMARHMCRWGLGGKQGPWQGVFFLDAAIWIAVAVILLCLAIHCSPEIHQAIHDIPEQLHEAIDSITAWWKGQ